MKLKILLSTLIFAVVATVAVSQFSNPVSASPITSPITAPISSAMKQISGVVRYLDLHVYRFLPASGASVKATNNKTSDVFTATTDANGKYTLFVPVGKYSLMASDSNLSNYKFVPNLNNLPILFDFKGLDFFGLKH